LARTFTKEYGVIATYQSLYESKYNRPIQVNKYKEKWAVQSLIDDFGYESVVETLNFYFKVSKDGHPLSWFYSNFDMLNNARLNKEQDDRIRAERRKKTIEMVMERNNGVS